MFSVVFEKSQQIKKKLSKVAAIKIEANNKDISTRLK